MKEALLDCVEESERIIIMLNALTDISEAETDMMKLEIKDVNILNLIEEVVDLYSYVAEEKNITIYTKCQRGLSVAADPARLRQALANLLDNAIKYTPNGGRIYIEVFQKQRELVIAVKDTGIGIPSKEISSIWERLYRGDKSRSQRGL